MNEEILALMKANVEMDAKLNKAPNTDFTNLYCVTKKSETFIGYFNVRATEGSVKLDKIVKALAKSGIVAEVQDSEKRKPAIDDIDL